VETAEEKRRAMEALARRAERLKARSLLKTTAIGD
jgi:hypothetical protein